LEDDLETLYPSSPSSSFTSSFQPTLRVLSHPFRALPDSPAVDTRFRHLTMPRGGMEGGKEGGRQRPRLLLAIGPESGWDVSLRGGWAGRGKREGSMRKWVTTSDSLTHASIRECTRIRTRSLHIRIFNFTHIFSLSHTQLTGALRAGSLPPAWFSGTYVALYVASGWWWTGDFFNYRHSLCIPKSRHTISIRSLPVCSQSH
jgi:hypothetical protein